MISQLTAHQCTNQLYSLDEAFERLKEFIKATKKPEITRYAKQAESSRDFAINLMRKALIGDDADKALATEALRLANLEQQNLITLKSNVNKQIDHFIKQAKELIKDCPDFKNRINERITEASSLKFNGILKDQTDLLVLKYFYMCFSSKKNINSTQIDKILSAPKSHLNFRTVPIR